MASGIRDLGAPVLAYWLRTGLPVCLDRRAIEELEGGGGGDDLDRPAAVLGELDEGADRGGGARAAHDDGQDAAIRVSPGGTDPAGELLGVPADAGRGQGGEVAGEALTGGRAATSSGAVCSAARSAA